MIVQSELLKTKKKITTFYLMSRLQHCERLKCQVKAEWSTLIGRDCRDRALIGRELYRTEIFS